MTDYKAVPGTKVTPREYQVLCWMYYGKTNEEIARLLGISTLTVKNHVQKLLCRLGVPTRMRAVTIALEREIICMCPGTDTGPDEPMLRIPG